MNSPQAVGCMLVMLVAGGIVMFLFMRGSVKAAEVRARAFKQVAEAERQHGHELAAEATALEKMLAQQAFTIEAQQRQIVADRDAAEQLKEGVCGKNKELGDLAKRVHGLELENAALKDRERRMFGCRVRDASGKFAKQ